VIKSCYSYFCCCYLTARRLHQNPKAIWFLFCFVQSNTWFDCWGFWREKRITLIETNGRKGDGISFLYFLLWLLFFSRNIRKWYRQYKSETCRCFYSLFDHSLATEWLDIFEICYEVKCKVTTLYILYKSTEDATFLKCMHVMVYWRVSFEAITLWIDLKCHFMRSPWILYNVAFSLSIFLSIYTH
jgi:hypothetical protein